MARLTFEAPVATSLSQEEMDALDAFMSYMDKTNKTKVRGQSYAAIKYRAYTFAPQFAEQLFADEDLASAALQYIADA